MKKTLGLFLLLFNLCLCSPQQKQELIEDTTTEKEAVYYVKYASDGIRGAYNVEYTLESGKKHALPNMDGDTFERTVGPVSKGFVANYSIAPHVSTCIVNARIEVKKDDSPFVVKAETVSKTAGQPVKLSYTIE